MASVTITLVDPEYREDGPAPLEKVEAVAKPNGHDPLPVNGHTNGHGNGHSNGHTNGHTNGHSNGHSKIAENLPSDQVTAKAGETVAEDSLAGDEPRIHKLTTDGTLGEHENHQGGDGAASLASKLSVYRRPRFAEVTVTRRLFRSGESEYLINGKTARLRDIQDIFMGTGLGPESYAIIEQGRIGQILSSKPQDRRAVIEEAAGITRFKNRRRLAEARLQGAKHNVERVFDILEEVGRQMNSLKRQAAKAKRYEELHGEMITSLKATLQARFLSQEREAARVALELSAAAKQLAASQDELSEKDDAFRKTQSDAEQLAAQLTEARAKHAQITMEWERAKSRLQFQSTEADKLTTRVSTGGDEVRSLGAEIQRLEQEKEAHLEALKLVQAQLSEAREHFVGKDKERQELNRRLQEHERSLESTRQLSIRLLGEASQLRNQLAQVEEYLAGLERQKTRHQAEEQAALAEAGRLDSLKLDLEEKLKAHQTELSALVEKRKENDLRVQQSRQEVQQTRQALDAIRQEHSRIRARKDSLEDLISHRSYSTESVQRLFKAVDKGRANGLKPRGVLADFLEVEPAYEKAVEEFLQDELEYVLVESWEQGHTGVNLMRGEGDGRATFLLHEGTPTASGHPCPVPELGAAHGVFARLMDVLQVNPALGAVPLEHIPRIGRCFLVEEPSAAEGLALRYPDCFFLTPDGLCFQAGSISGGKRSASGPLVLKRQLKELQTKLRTTDEQLKTKETSLRGAEEKLTKSQEEMERLRGQIQAREKEGVALEAEGRKLLEEQRRAGSRLQVARSEMARLLRDADAAILRKETSVKALAEKDAARTEREQLAQQVRHEIDELRREVARLGEEHSALRVAMAGFEERQRSERNTIERAENLLRETSRKQAELAKRLENEQREILRLREDNDALTARIRTLGEERDHFGSQVTALSETEGSARTGLHAQDAVLQELRARAQSQQESRTKLELDLVKRQAELKFLDETCVKELGLGIRELAAECEIVLDEEAVVESERLYLDLKRKVEALGAVNMNALEEFEEASKRHEFLSAQRQDLLDSIRDTEKAIREIDEESRKRFTEAFHAINEHFKVLFRTLFGGGTGEMRLAGDEDAAESGIEIVASPPGKRLQNVLLLSGGEKALTAISLLMAIFRYQPSPFCILDEVDAPLDEPNNVRYVSLIKEMAKQTQFIMITHAKRSMEAAQMLYGVTMQEAGVSKVVSVNFNGLNIPAVTGSRNTARMTM
ncbi:MAG: chromosome segregation protein SMC [Bryobacterales bacterium]|nr:chromosome segregation protein SMC [Bryobacterales bacterium]